MLGKHSLVSSADKHQFVIKAIDIAWSLVTAVPPLIPSCDERTFHDDLHEKSIYWDDECQTNYKIKYIRPVLYTNSLGAITQKGSVRNAKLDEGKIVYICTVETGLCWFDFKCTQVYTL